MPEGHLAGAVLEIGLHVQRHAKVLVEELFGWRLRGTRACASCMTLSLTHLTPDRQGQREHNSFGLPGQALKTADEVMVSVPHLHSSSCLPSRMPVLYTHVAAQPGPRQHTLPTTIRGQAPTHAQVDTRIRKQVPAQSALCTVSAAGAVCAVS